MEEAFEKLRKQLEQEDWPSLYLFKFITPSDNQKIARIIALFNSETADIIMKPSNEGNYTSISVKEVMIGADAVMNIYKKAALIKGVMVF